MVVVLFLDVIFDLELMQTGFFDLVGLLELFVFALFFVDFVSEYCVHLFSGEEFVDHFADICVSGGLFYLLESAFNRSIL